MHHSSQSNEAEAIRHNEKRDTHQGIAKKRERERRERERERETQSHTHTGHTHTHRTGD